MRLLVSCIPYDRGKSGISVYCREVVRELAGQGHSLTILVEPDVAHPPAGDGGEEAPPPPGAGLPGVEAVVAAPRWTRRPAASMFWHLFLLPFWIRRRRRDFDGFVIGAANRRVCAWYLLPTTATVHDLANFHIPGKYSRLRMFYLARVLPFFAKRAPFPVAISEATKADMATFWRCPPERVTVLYDGLRLDPGAEAGKREPEGGGRKSAILYISRIEHPGKNHLRLIEAYGRLPRALAEAHPLVLVGADWKDAEVVHAAAAASPYAGSIRFTGFAADADLARLWDETGFYVFPSLFEGFGLSLVEAMARGIPCACSGNGSLGEIGEGVAIPFDPSDTGSVAGALQRLLDEPDEERAARVARGLERARRFSWADHAAGLVRLLGGRGRNT